MRPFCPIFDLLKGLVLNWVGNISIIEISPPKCARLREAFKFHDIVRTARCTGPPIGERFDHGMTAGALYPINNLFGRGSCICRFYDSDSLHYPVAINQQPFEVIEKIINPKTGPSISRTRVRLLTAEGAEDAED